MPQSRLLLSPRQTELGAVSFFLPYIRSASWERGGEGSELNEEDERERGWSMVGGVDIETEKRGGGGRTEGSEREGCRREKA